MIMVGDDWAEFRGVTGTQTDILTDRQTDTDRQAY